MSTRHKTMLIDASHAEETRVVILDEHGRIDDFEAETQGKQQLKGNIYIGHVSRVEPSLQAAFITYGGNRNGFLAFGEVHPQFFALKDGERAELLNEMAEQAARRKGHDDAEETDTTSVSAQPTTTPTATTLPELTPSDNGTPSAEATATPETTTQRKPHGNRRQPKRVEARARPQRVEASAPAPEAPASLENQPLAETDPKSNTKPGKAAREPRQRRTSAPQSSTNSTSGSASRQNGYQAPIHRRYRIQDVLKEGQKIMVQVVKEERGSKGAALTTYFSLPGRYTVLMPNTPSAGGISRKVTDHQERQLLRQTYAQLQVPDTMGLIIRTAGVGQEISHIQRDYQNLTNLWQHINSEYDKHQDIQCIHEDGSVIIRALRDMMNEDVGEVIISGARAYKLAKDYAKNLMPDVAPFIKQHKDETPLFTQHKVEQKLNHLHHNRVTLPSGGYLVINPTEALVAVDINSGRATQERNIEETAAKTNLEACDELARQIRLRDLAGLIVVDFIDMEDHRNTRKVENAMRKALRKDRARIQTGNISEFGLMEISRQRLRPSFGESHFIPCPHCLGSGNIHSDATSALMVLRRLEEDDIRGADRVIIHSSAELVLWLLNHKRDLIRTLEERYKYQLQFRADSTLIAPDHKIELVRIKADGTEASQVLHVQLREQPELPPEKRPYRQDQRPEANRADNRSDNRLEPRAELRPEPRPEPRAERTPPVHPREAKAAPAPRAETPQPPVPAPKTEPKQPAKPKAEAAKPAKPKAEVRDEPLAVQKVAAELEASATAIVAPPKRSVVIKKQADTDRNDAPLAVEKVAVKPGGAEEMAIPAKPAKKPAGGGLISRLMGGK